MFDYCDHLKVTSLHEEESVYFTLGFSAAPKHMYNAWPRASRSGETAGFTGIYAR